jgi:hypothetical protein
MVARLVLTVIAGFFVTSFAVAQSGAPQDRNAKADRHFSYTDTNSDGYIGREEASLYPALMKHFHVIESNKDGKLDKDEMQAYRNGTYSRKRAASAARKSGSPENHGDDGLTRADAENVITASRKNN